MAWFGQGKDTIEWEEFRDDVLFYKWPGKEIKKGSKLIIRPGQKAIFYVNGAVDGVIEKQGSFDIESEITPFLSTLKGFFSLRGDTGMRAEVYFVNAKELVLPWGTRQRIMIPTPEVPSGIPVGMNGNLIVEFRDYQKFIDKVAGVKDTYTLDDISERIMGELNPVLAEAILDGRQTVGVNALVGLQANSRKLSKTLTAELDSELTGFGLGVADVNILSVNYPEEVQKMAEKVAGQAFVGDVGKYAAVSMADSFNQPGGGDNMATMGAQVAMGAQMAQQMAGAMGGGQAQAQPAPGAAPTAAVYTCAACGNKTDQPAKFCPACGQPMQAAPPPAENADGKFCPKCRKMVSSDFCPECGTQTV
ncbi:SPFH domain-containing protein [Ruminococcaceae bacterium OttesenSCG-928-I18]|nr:SPFH domain-containing protein [Ruminococcaceae bacterium OttesenSCG-928-I18]